MESSPDHLAQPITSLARQDFTALPQDLTIAQALEHIRTTGVGEKIIYFYVVDGDGRLAGVLPTRRLLTAAIDQRVRDIMIERVIAIPHTATVMDACELFLCHKFLAFPVVDAQRMLVGVVDVGLFTEEVVDVSEHERMDDVFQTIGFRVAEVQNASPAKAFRFRFPWLLATIGSGTLCALLAGAYEATLAGSLVLAFFLTLVLGLGESVSAQSVTVTVQAIHGLKVSWAWFARAIRRELGTAGLLGLACGAAVVAVVWLWRGAMTPALVIGGSVAASVVTASLLGLCIPAALHALKLDPKIAAGPITLAVADIFTLLVYFNLAKVAL
jgi:magnesium transporter